MTALWELSISVLHGFATLFKEIKIVVDYDVAFQSHTQIVLHVQVVEFGYHYTANSDDMWASLDDEIQQIEKFLQMK